MLRHCRLEHNSEIQNITMSITRMHRRNTVLRQVSEAVTLGNAKVGTITNTHQPYRNSTETLQKPNRNHAETLQESHIIVAVVVVVVIAVVVVFVVDVVAVVVIVVDVAFVVIAVVDDVAVVGAPFFCCINAF